MNTTQDLIDKVLFHKTAIIKNMVAAIIMVAIFGFEGCFNFATLTWSIDKLADPAHWVKVSTKVILFLAIKTVALLTFMDVARRTNKNLIKQKNINDKYMKLKGNDFPYYVETILNPSIKIEAWKKHIKNKLVKLTEKAKPYDKALYFKIDNPDRQLNKYCIVREELELELTDEWIDKNKDCLTIKHYEQVNPDIFDIPVNASKDNKWQLTSKAKTAIAISLTTGIIFLTISQSIWQATGFDKLDSYDPLAIWISMLMDLVFLCWQFFTGVTKAFTTVNDEEVIPYCNRNRILKQYIFWKQPEKKDNLTIWLQRLEQEAEKEAIDNMNNNKDEEGA